MPPCAAVLAEARRVAWAYLRRKARCLRLSPLQRCDSSNQKREAGREKGTEGHLVRKDPGMLAPSYVVPHAQRLPPHHQNTHTHTHTYIHNCERDGARVGGPEDQVHVQAATCGDEAQRLFAHVLCRAQRSTCGAAEAHGAKCPTMGSQALSCAKGLQGSTMGSTRGLQ